MTGREAGSWEEATVTAQAGGRWCLWDLWQRQSWFIRDIKELNAKKSHSQLHPSSDSVGEKPELKLPASGTALKNSHWFCLTYFQGLGLNQPGNLVWGIRGLKPLSGWQQLLPNSYHSLTSKSGPSAQWDSGVDQSHERGKKNVDPFFKPLLQWARIPPAFSETQWYNKNKALTVLLAIQCPHKTILASTILAGLRGTSIPVPRMPRPHPSIFK